MRNVAKQIYSVTIVNSISAQHKYVKKYLNGIPIEKIVDCGSNATILTVEAINKIKLKGHKLASSLEKLMECQSKEISVFGEYSVQAQNGKDKFQEKVLVQS